MTDETDFWKKYRNLIDEALCLGDHPTLEKQSKYFKKMANLFNEVIVLGDKKTKIQSLTNMDLQCPFCKAIGEARTNICKNCSIFILSCKINELIEKENKKGVDEK